MTASRRAATGSAATFQNNTWCYLINKTFKQLNAERNMKITYCFRCHRKPKQDEWYNDRLCINCKSKTDEEEDEDPDVVWWNTDHSEQK